MQRVTKPEEFLEPSPAAVRPSGFVEAAAVRALVIEDEPKVADALRRGLQREAMDVSLAHTVEEALHARRLGRV